MSVHSKSKDIQIALPDRRFVLSTLVELYVEGLKVADSTSNPELFSVSSPNIKLHLQGLDLGEPSVKMCDIIVGGETWYTFALLMAGMCVKDTNSYIATRDSDLYHALRLRTKWLGVDIESRESHLISACNILNTKNWVGDKYDPSQILPWPRLINNELVMPQCIKDAQCELAYSLMCGFEPSLPVSNLRIGNFSVSGSSKAKSDLPDHVHNLINSYIDYSVKLIRS